MNFSLNVDELLYVRDCTSGLLLQYVRNILSLLVTFNRKCTCANKFISLFAKPFLMKTQIHGHFSFSNVSVPFGAQ